MGVDDALRRRRGARRVADQCRAVRVDLGEAIEGIDVAGDGLGPCQESRADLRQGAMAGRHDDDRLEVGKAREFRLEIG